MSGLLDVGALCSRFDAGSGELEGAASFERRLSDLRGAFVDEGAYEAALALDDPVIYTVATSSPARGEGALNCAMNRILPGRIGREYFLTKGHFHAWRAAGEYYIGLSGEGVMLLEDEAGESCRMAPLQPDSALYVPGYTAHRTINTGRAPLVYLTVFPAEAGNDYGPIARHNFRKVVVEMDGKPTPMERSHFLAQLREQS
jgi:glucose-6-phosphate isomerase, archaeal